MPPIYNSRDVSHEVHALILDQEELEFRVPGYLSTRVMEEKYYYTIYESIFPPSSSYGRKGDIWIQSVRKNETIHIRDITDSWKPWTRYIHTRERPQKGSERWHARQDSRHPWLIDRYLQFDGSSVTWLKDYDYVRISCGWDATVLPLMSSNALAHAYDSLTVGWIARYALRRQPLLTDSIVMTVPPGRLAITADGLSESSTPTPSSPSSSDSGTAYSPPPVAVVVKEEPSSPVCLSKQSRTRSYSSGKVVATIKRAKDEEISTAVVAVPRSRAVRPQPIVSAPGVSPEVFRWLRELPIPLDGHNALFGVIGVTTMDHLESLACMPSNLLDEFIGFMKRCGVNFAECLILRTALERMRAGPARNILLFGIPRYVPTSEELFLARLHPPMPHLSNIFSERKINMDRLRHLNTLDVRSCIGTLRVQGLTLAESFIIKSAMQNL